MSLAVAAVFCGAVLMTSTGNLKVEPGQQVPRSLSIQSGDNADATEATLRYQLFVPSKYKAKGEKWPLLLFLHGLGECSDDDLSKVKIHGPAKIVESRPDFPFVVVSPQCPPPVPWAPGKPFPKTSQEIIELVQNAWNVDQLIQLVDHVRDNLNIDTDRVYVTGLSMGGYGTWRLVAKYPDRFAAAVPICGGGNPATMAESLSKTPIWAFHGAKDPTVPLAESERMVQAVQRAGGDVKLTVYPEVGHLSWVPTYENQEVYNWLLAHRRNRK
jgi:predicted peptidase